MEYLLAWRMAVAKDCCGDRRLGLPRLRSGLRRRKLKPPIATSTILPALTTAISSSTGRIELRINYSTATP